MGNEPSSSFSLQIFAAYGLIVLSSLAAWLFTENIFFLAIAPTVLIAHISIFNFKVLFYLLVFMLPLSTEYYLPNGVGTDLPTEPLMVLLTLLLFMHLLIKPKKISKHFLMDPLVQIVFLHLIWLSVSVLYSNFYLISIKFLLAKIWYVATFLILAGMVIREEKDFRQLFWYLFIPLLSVTIVTLVRHYGDGFAFSTVNRHVTPYFRNHVNYASMLAIFYPFIWLAHSWYPKGSFVRKFLGLSILIFTFAIYVSYTRAAWLGLLLMAVGYLVIKRGWLKQALGISFVSLGLLIAFLVNDNRYLNFAPDYTKVIIHDEIGEHMEATYQLKDLSSVERIYRWIAAAKMSFEEPLTGFGPGNFYTFYKSHVSTAFTTWVSGNPEKSGVHNYFLMTLVEQGFIGLLIFIALMVAIFWKGQQIYNECTDHNDKKLVMALLLSTIAIYELNFLSDLIEVDKVGTIFFMNIAILVNIHLKNRKRLPG